jgi:hypothetical protein
MSVVPFALETFEMEPFTSSIGRTRDIYRRGSGPAVIIIHEMPGITPSVAEFARRADHGMTVVPGQPITIPYARGPGSVTNVH